MFAIIKDEQIIGFTTEEITKENMLFDQLIEGSFDPQKIYKFENGSVSEDIEKMQEKENQEKENQKQTLILNLGELKQKFDGMVLLGEDTTEIESKILELQNIYKSL